MVSMDQTIMAENIVASK